MNLDFPFHFDDRGRTAETSDLDYSVDLLLQFFFTRPGERVNRPTFGGGLHARVFEPNSDLAATVVKDTVQAGLQEWLREWIAVARLEVTVVDEKLLIDLDYVHRASGRKGSTKLSKEIPAL